MTKSDQKVYTAIKRAVHAGITAVGGIEGVRKLSLFPSASKQAEGAKKAIDWIKSIEQIPTS